MLRIAGIINESIVDGEGYRMAVFTQGCNHNCPGCQNPNTHDFNGGEEMEWQDIYNRYKEMPWLDGITLTGGDPFFQAKELTKLVKALKKDNVSIWAYTGFVFDEFLNFINDKSCDKRITKDMITLLKSLDVVVDGPFIENEKTLDEYYRGSKNQRLVDVKKTLKLNKVELYELKG
jgi:anaerobic ribonucleoside-triphosphate reductase activating protein